jgi:hypothetical protein
MNFTPVLLMASDRGSDAARGMFHVFSKRAPLVAEGLEESLVILRF